MRPERALLTVLAMIVVLLCGGCAPKSPEEKIAAARAKYAMQPSGILVREIEPEPAAEAMDAEEGAAAEAMAEDEEVTDELEFEAPEGGPRTVNVLFDLILTFDGREALPGITIEVTHRDPFEKEKAHFRQWIETAGLGRGEARQISFEKEIANFETGDDFAIEIRPFVPPEERGNYREFAAAGS